jgi:hypothetical protein
MTLGIVVVLVAVTVVGCTGKTSVEITYMVDQCVEVTVIAGRRGGSLVVENRVVVIVVTRVDVGCCPPNGGFVVLVCWLASIDTPTISSFSCDGLISPIELADANTHI